MKYTDVWNDLTQKMGYWVDLDNPYVTCDNKYIESVWWLLKNLYDKNLLYKGYTIQPYSPAAGTGLSSHELNLPGCYKNVKDRSAVAMFKCSEKIEGQEDMYLLAWTTTPWTLPSNTALAVGAKIEYVEVRTYHPHPPKDKQHLDAKPIRVVLAKDLLNKYFPEKNSELKFEDYKKEDKNIPYQIVNEYFGSSLDSMSYNQLLEFAKPTDGDGFRVVIGDFVTTEDGTGIVHIAPSFGADDFRVAKQNKLGSLTLVDSRGKFLPEVQDGIFLYGDEFVKEAYLSEDEKEAEFRKQKEILEKNGKIKELKSYLSVDERIILKLQEEGKLFKKETYEHNYPHCWRTDKPILYYPLDSWFIKVTEKKTELIELNKTINWKPESTGTGRFGNWLENANDWNLSRSRYWGIPLPIWTNEEGEKKCIGSIQELKEECEKSVNAGLMKKNPLADFNPSDFSEKNYSVFDLHRPYVDEIVLISDSGKPLHRETDLIDVWFDSGAMPYAQMHYPHENIGVIENGGGFPADYIAEGVDQTRGWFYTLHVIAALCFNSVAYKNVISNGLVLDKNGQKMSKRLGNAVDPFETLSKYGADATRWYMISNSQPWDNLKFDTEGIEEVQRKFFRALYNSYAFFALYANIDNFHYSEPEIPLNEKPEIDRWIISKLHSLIKYTDAAYQDYEPTKAARAIQEFALEHLSNWYVRLCRRRFWKGEYSQDKIAAYQTLYQCLEVLSQLSAPIAPFFSERLFTDLNTVTGRYKNISVHLADFPTVAEDNIDLRLEEKMEIAQKLSSMVLSIRKKENIRVRQPLTKMMVPVPDETFKSMLNDVKDIILHEVNVKQLEFLTPDNNIIVKKIKPNFKTLGPKFGKLMKEIAGRINAFGSEEIIKIEKSGSYELEINNEKIVLLPEDFEISSQDIPGWMVATEGKYTVALDITVTEDLKDEGIAREFVNRIQNLRKDKGLDVTDKIAVKVQNHKLINTAINKNLHYICSETLASSLSLVESLKNGEAVPVEIDEDIQTLISIEKN
jgi:isoleucyl-tRNA synthetase